ncbi:MAG: hypothetical protein IPI73_17740 [Betaproteobacteria bacterium]|nr:hypothetical protein [Betaproteobacteria bacterium]
MAGSLTSMLELSQLDLVFAPIIGTPPRAIWRSSIQPDELTVVARTGHPFFRKRSKTMADLLQYSWIIPPRHTSATSWLEERFAVAGLAPPKVMLEVDYAGSATIDLAAATDLLLLSPGAGPSRGGQKCVRRIDIPELEFKRPVYPYRATRMLLVSQHESARQCAFTDMTCIVQSGVAITASRHNSMRDKARWRRGRPPK